MDSSHFLWLSHLKAGTCTWVSDSVSNLAEHRKLTQLTSPAALIIPLASGTAPACKGVMMEMVTKAHRADALSAISLTELLATVSTVSMFGSVFAYLSKIGKPNLVFLLNAVSVWTGDLVACNGSG